jgi:hypothetical protein
LILISLNYSSHPALLFRHKHGSYITPLLVNNDPLGPFLHLVEIGKLRGGTEPAENGLSVTDLGRPGPRRQEDTPVDLGGLDEQPVRVEWIEQLPVDLDILQHLLVLEVTSVLLEIELDCTLVRG